MAEYDPYALRTLVDIALLLELGCGAAANCLVLRVFYQKPALLTIANRFIVNLTIINIIACFSLLPLSIADNALTPSSTFLPIFCSLSDFASHFTASVIPFSVLLIAIDQYFAVVDPLHYHSVITGVRSVWMISAAWLLPLLLSVLGLVKAETQGHRQSIFQICALARSEANATAIEELSPENTWLPLIFSLTFVASSFVVPFFLICFIYSRICAAASGNAKRTKPDMGHLPEKDSTVSCTDSSRVTEQDEVEWDEEDGGLQMIPAPSLTVTRPSPPRTEAPRTCRSDADLTAKHTLVIVKVTHQIKNNISLPNLKVSRTDVEPGLLKPFLPRNTSFCLPSTRVVPQRRHSNVPIPRVDSADILPKPRSLSNQSSFTNSSRSSSSRLPVSRASSIRSTSSYLVSNLRHRLSNAGLFRYRERARAARVSALVVVMALLCWLPFFVVYLLHAAVDFLPIPSVPQLVNAASVVLLLVSTVASPALFAFRNRKIRKEIRKIFKVPVNEFRTCPGTFSRRHFFRRVKQQAIELISNLKPLSDRKAMTSVVSVKPSA